MAARAATHGHAPAAASPGRCAIMLALRMTVVAGRSPVPARIAFRIGASLAACLAVLVLSGAPAAAAPPAALTVGSGWEIHPDPTFVGLAQGWSAGHAATGWTPTTVPGVFDARPLPQLFGGTVMWYRVTFTGPPAPPGFAWGVHFGQVRRTATVWLNGRYLGSNGDPYSPFVLTARGLRSGRPNTLIVRVDNRKGVEPREGWWNWGGITQPVSLVPLGPVVTANPGVLGQVQCGAPDACSARILFDATLTNRSPVRETPQISVILTPPSGGPLTRGRDTAPALAPGASEDVRFSFPLAGAPDLWAPGHPALYTTRVSTFAGATVSQVDAMQTGLRSVTVRDGQLYLNDRPVQLSGASIEEDVPGRGPALTPADMDQIVAELQALHANVTRAQYPLDPRLLDRLDQAGIMVWSQAPIYHRDELLVTASERHTALATMESAVLQSRNHASVITHSVANELTPTPDTTPGTRRYLDDAVRDTKALDPTLPVSIDLLSYPNYPAQRTYHQFQLLGINNYFGWYSGRPPHSTAQLADLAPYLETMHRDYPQQALVMTEFGAEATFDGPVTVKGSYAYQTYYIEQTLDIVRALPFMNGAIYWTLREFAVKPDWYGGGGPTVDEPRDSLHHKGLIAYDGTPKPAFAATSAEFASTPLYRTPPSAPTPVWVAIATLALSLLAVGLLAAFDVWLFAGIRHAARRRARGGRVLGESPSRERSYA